MKKVSAVIATFNNVLMLKILIRDLLSQTRPLDEIIVVDNASVDNTAYVMGNSFPEIKYIRQLENTGSAGAYYRGINEALGNSDLIWTLDDDVRVPSNSLEELIKGFEKLNAKLRVSSVRSTGVYHTYDHPTRLELFPWRGTLIKSELIRKYGLPIKECFIYGEDLEYAMRFNKRGFFCYWIPNSKCIENRREGKTEYRLIRKVATIYESAFRLYYAFRNEFYIFIKYKEYRRIIRHLLFAFKAALCIFVFERQERPTKIMAISNGVLDGIRGRLGKNYKYLPDHGRLNNITKKF